MSQDDKCLFAVMQSTDRESFEVIPLMSIPTCNNSWFIDGVANPPDGSVMYRDLNYNEKTGFVAFVGTKREATRQCENLSKLNLNDLPSATNQEVFELKSEVAELSGTVANQAKSIAKLEAFQRENQYLIRKVQSLDSDHYNLIGLSDIKVTHDDLAMAISKDDLKGYSYLAKLILKISSKKTSGNKWSLFTDEEKEDLDNLLSYYIIMKDKYEEKRLQSVIQDPLSKNESLLKTNELLETRCKRVKNSFQRKMQGKDEKRKATDDQSKTGKSSKKKKKDIKSNDADDKDAADQD